MSTIYLDPVQMDATAGAVGEHAREAEVTVTDLETACSADVPASLAGWLADELHDIAVHVRMAALLYTVAALDTALRAQQISADQSLATAVPALASTAPAFAEAPLVGGLVLSGSSTVGTPFAAGAPVVGGFVLGEVDTSGYVPIGGQQQGFLLGASGPNTPLGGYTPSSGGGGVLGALVDIPGYESTNRKLNSTPGRTYISGQIYVGNGMRGTFHRVLPDPGHDE